MNLLYDEQQGHDAQFEGIAIDAVNNTVSLKFLSYPVPDSSKRIPITIRFSQVVSSTFQIDLIQLANNRVAGNVAYWHISQGAGTSYIYLVEGYLSVTTQAAPELILN